MSIISGGGAVVGAGGAAAYEIERSLRFNSADSAYLNRTPASAGNRKTWTWSGWVKRSNLGAAQLGLFTCHSANTDTASFNINFESDKIAVVGWSTTFVNSNAVYRDVSAWYHIVVKFDATQGTASNRLNVYVNGVEVSYGTDNRSSISNQDYGMNQAAATCIGASAFNNSNFFPGYLTEINFIDGQALTPSSFGETNPTTGVWQPIKYTGSYGTNGFYLNFSDNASTTTLGDDLSGNGNDWTTNNFSVTAGAGNDSLVDTPTPYGTDTGAGGEVRGNYATLNALDNSGGVTLANGNLQATWSTQSQRSVLGTIGIPASGKFYAEFLVGATTSAISAVTFGLATASLARTSNGSGAAGAWVIAANDNRFVSRNGTTSTFGSGQTFASGTILQVAIDRDNNQAWLGFNNTWINSTTGTNGDPSAGTNPTVSSLPADLFILVGFFNNNGNVNFGQRPFAYTAPSGFKALCTQNLPEPTIKDGGDYFNTILYTGTGSSNALTGVGFQPDWVWIKQRSGVTWHALYDVNRGVTKSLASNATDAEDTRASGLTAFNSDGFTLGSDNNVNGSGNTYVAWNWKANGAGVSNTAGTITSTVSVNTTSGFSIVTYTGTGANATVGHGLGAVPSMIIVKNRDAADAWQVYHAANTANPETDYLVLNTTAATADNADRWNDTLPTSTVFSIGNGVEVNTNTEKYVAYCFAAIPGYSAFGSYTGNGSADGPFIFTNHRPAFVLIKRTDTTSNWTILDFQREGYNVDNDPLYPNLSNAEGTTDLADLLSNGFKLRTTDASVNASGGTYIYMSLASNPFKFSLAR